MLRRRTRTRACSARKSTTAGREHEGVHHPELCSCALKVVATFAVLCENCEFPLQGEIEFAISRQM